MEDFNENDKDNDYSNTINLDTDFQLIESTKIIKDRLKNIVNEYSPK